MSRSSRQAKLVTHFQRAFCLPLLLALSCSSQPTAAVLADQRDYQVLEALLLQLLHDPNLQKYGITRISTNDSVVVLHTRNPSKTGFLQEHQMRADTDSQPWPLDAEEALRRRNSRANYDSVTAYYTNLVFSSRILVADLSEVWSSRSILAFEEAYPKARAYVSAHLPGYSRDGVYALVRASIGPSAHGAMVTALLEKVNDKWIVKWHQISLYA